MTNHFSIYANKSIRTLKSEGFLSLIKKIGSLLIDLIELPYWVIKIRKMDFKNKRNMVKNVVSNPSRIFSLIRSNQNEDEIYQLLSLVESVSPKSVLEIGTARGGTLFMLSQVLDPNANIISIDIPKDRYSGGYPIWKIPIYKSFKRKNQKIKLIRKNSHAVSTADIVQNYLDGHKIDFLFIDGDHSYDGVKKDFEMYHPLVRSGGLIAFHDIVPGPTEKVGGVPEFWKEIKDSYEHKEFVNDWNQERYGIGVIFLNH